MMMMMEVGSVKMKREINETLSGYDYISTLPDCVLSHIISLLPTEDAFRASFVSKTWKSLWSPLSILDLDFDRFSKNSCLKDRKKRFCDFVKRVLKLHKDVKLQELRLSFDISDFRKDGVLVDEWVCFAMTSNTTALELNFKGEKQVGNYGCYRWPECPLLLQSVRIFRLHHCRFKAGKNLRYASIKTAVLTSVRLSDKSLHSLIKCPCLEELHLIHCAIPTDLSIHRPGSKLKCLVLDYSNSYDLPWSINIDIPSLVRFKYVGEPIYYFTIEKPTNLIEAELNFNFEDILSDSEDDDDDEFALDATRRSKMMRNLVKSISNASSLTLSRVSLQILTCEPEKAAQAIISGSEIDKFLLPSFPNLKHLTLKLHVGHDIAQLGILLQSSPNLETLSLDITAEDLVDEELLAIFNLDEEFYWKAYFVPCHCLCLKKVEIKGFEGRMDEMLLLKVILENSLALEEMVIYKAALESRYAWMKLNGDKKERKLLKADQEKTIEELLSFKRGSSEARILII